MTVYRITALEKFVVRTTYNVDANNPEEAEQKCRAGSVGYDKVEVLEGDEEWLETSSCEEA